MANDSRSARHWSARTYHITKKRFSTYEAAKAAAYARDVQCIGVPSAPPPAGRGCRPPRQDFALNLSAKRRLCHTVGRRRVESCPARCCVVSAARSRAAATSSLARSNQSLVLRVLRVLFGGPKSSALVNIFMICPRWSVASPPRPNYAPDHGHLMAIKPNHPARDPDGGRPRHASSAKKPAPER